MKENTLESINLLISDCDKQCRQTSTFLYKLNKDIREIYLKNTFRENIEETKILESLLSRKEANLTLLQSLQRKHSELLNERVGAQNRDNVLRKTLLQKENQRKHCEKLEIAQKLKKERQEKVYELEKERDKREYAKFKDFLKSEMGSALYIDLMIRFNSHISDIRSSFEKEKAQIENFYIEQYKNKPKS